MRHQSIYLILLVGAVVALYGGFLGNAIVFDDLYFFLSDTQGNLPVEHFDFSLGALRSLPYATLAWEQAAWGNGLTHYRLVNLALHGATTLALFYLLFALLTEHEPSIHRRMLVAFSGALLFALHPIAVYGAGYLVQRTIVMATLFSLMAMLAWCRALKTDNAGWGWLAVLCYYLAAFSKEHSIMLPAVLVALTVLQRADWGAFLRRQWAVLFGMSLVMCWVVLASRGVLGSVYEINAGELIKKDAPLNYPLSVLTQSWLFFKYAGLWLIPNPRWMSVDMREPFAEALWSIYLLGFVAYIAWGGIAAWLLRQRGRAGLIGFALLFPWLMFMTEFSTVRIQEIFVLYRSYLWAAGAFLLVPLLLSLLPTRWILILVGALVLAYIPASLDRLASFSHPLILWNDAEKLVHDNHDVPGAGRIYYNRGTELLKADYYDGAIQDLKLAVALGYQEHFAWHNLGAAYGKKADWPNSIHAFSQAIISADRYKLGINPRTYYGRALSYLASGDSAAAKRDFEVSCHIAKLGCDQLEALSTQSGRIGLPTVPAKK